MIHLKSFVHVQKALKLQKMHSSIPRSDKKSYRLLLFLLKVWQMYLFSYLDRTSCKSSTIMDNGLKNQLKLQFSPVKFTHALWTGHLPSVQLALYRLWMCPVCFVGFCSGGKSETESSELSDICLTLQDAKTTAFRPVMKRWGRWALWGCARVCAHTHTFFFFKSYYPYEGLSSTDRIN